MELKCEAMHALCAMEIFVINGVEADYEDFGEKYDDAPNRAKDYRCGNMVFKEKRHTKGVLDKYKISIDEYYEVCDWLKEELSLGACCWCS